MGKSRRSLWTLYSVLTLLGGGILCLLGSVLYCDLIPHVWDDVDCRILESDILKPERPRDAAYVLRVRYSCVYGGRAYRSNACDFYDLTSGSLEFVKGILARYPSGSMASCHVNPEEPDEAVLVPDFLPESLLNGLIALPFIAIGAWGYYRILRG